MSEEPPPDELSSSSFSLVATLKDKSARSIFILNMSRIELLLKGSSEGIARSKKTSEDILSKIVAAIDRGDVEDDEGDDVRVNHLPDGTISIKLSNKEAKLIHDVVDYQFRVLSGLDYYLYNVLLVSAWSAFEGYLQSALAEIFVSNPHLLESQKLIEMREIVSARDRIVDFLAEREIEDIGRKNFNDLQKYLQSKLHIQFPNSVVPTLQGAYFLRNVIAHSAGFLRASQLELLPEGIEVEESQLRLTDSYLRDLFGCLKKAVTQFDKLAQSKNWERTAQRFPKLPGNADSATS